MSFSSSCHFCPFLFWSKRDHRVWEREEPKPSTNKHSIIHLLCSHNNRWHYRKRYHLLLPVLTTSCIIWCFHLISLIKIQLQTINRKELRDKHREHSHRAIHIQLFTYSTQKALIKAKIVLLNMSQVFLLHLFPNPCIQLISHFLQFLSKQINILWQSWVLSLDEHSLNEHFWLKLIICCNNDTYYKISSANKKALRAIRK